MVLGLSKTRRIVIVTSDETCASLLTRTIDTVASVMCDVDVRVIDEDTASNSQLGNMDIIFIHARSTVGDGDAISFVGRHASEWQKTQVVFIDGEPTATPAVYQVEHAYLLPRSFSPKQVEAALLRADGRLRLWEERPFGVKIRAGEKVVYPRQISYIESDRRVLHIHSAGGAIRSYGKISELSDLLPASFIQCHKSFLVNLAYVSELSRDALLLTTGDRVPVSQKRRRATREALDAFLGRVL